ncbi:DUF4062 domain-containing protein [Dokdonella sp. MW10]|uniref:DUF4062 domain-containing protein n=1 Tax=Dokdonella sp. MW10 TaxID=2992926 RepID=UPI003F7F34C5
MPKGHPTTLFVSSTCYDLGQVRTDLAEFSRSLGLEPILSELDSFPVDPSLDTVSNCLEIVRSRADIFLLIVGNRYGSVTEAGKSVTNLEFLEASARGIPRYVFVKREIITLLSTWKANPEADFKASVDTPKLFEFVSGLRSSGDLWVFPFDSAQDISQVMRKQLSFLLSDCLELRSRLQTRDESVIALGPQTLRIYVEKPYAWEFKAFARALQECMALHKARRYDYELGISLGRSIILKSRAAAMDWIQEKVAQMGQTVEQLTKAVNGGMQVAVGKPGEPGDIGRIWHLAERVSDAYEELLSWALEFNRVIVDDEFKKAISLTQAVVAESISQLEGFSASLFENVVEALQKPEEQRKITLNLSIGDTSELMNEMKRLYAR